MKLAVVEDDDIQAGQIRTFAARFSAQKGQEIRIERYRNGLAFLEAYRGDVDGVLMDIAMPVMDGMECAHKLRQQDEQVPIIFITSMAQYAIRGYEVEAMAFMVKPLRYEEFAMKMERLLRRMRSGSTAHYAIVRKEDTRVVPVSAILFVEVLNHDLVFHTTQGDYQAYGSLRTLEEDERFADFLKASPAHLVNAVHVTGIGKDTLTAGGLPVPLSRRRRKECLEKLARIIGGRLA